MKPKVTVGAGKTLLLQRWLQAKEGWPLHGTLLFFGPTDSSHPGRQSLGEDGKVPVSAGSPPPAGTVLTCMHCAHTHTHTHHAVDFGTELSWVGHPSLHLLGVSWDVRTSGRSCC